VSRQWFRHGLQLIGAVWVTLATAAFVVLAIAMFEASATDQQAWPEISFFVAAATMSFFWIAGSGRKLFPGIFALTIVGALGTLLTYLFFAAEFDQATTMTVVSVVSCLVSFLFFRIVTRRPIAKAGRP